MSLPAVRSKALTGAQKAAIFALAAGDEHARRLFAQLDIEEIKAITQGMAQVGAVTVEMIEAVLRDFADNMGNASALVGNFDAAERLLRAVLPLEQVTQIMEEVRGPAGRNIWEKLGNVNQGVLASYLKNECPQTIAVVLSKVKAGQAAGVLAKLPRDTAIETILRMLSMESVQKEVVSDVEHTLRQEFMNNLARTQRRDHHEMMAEIFNFFDRATESRFMGLLEERRSESAERIRKLMFTFEDLVKIDGPGIQTLLRHIDNSKLGLALKGAGELLRELFFANMSERAAKILREDMEVMGPVRVKDVDEAQNSLVVIAKDLAASGEITIADSKDDEMIE